MRMNYSSDGSSENEDFEAVECSEAGKFVRAPVRSNTDIANEEQDGGEYGHYHSEINPNHENDILRQQLADMQKVIDELSAGARNSQQQEVSANDAEESWNCFRNTQWSQPEGNIPSIRWDQMKPFPTNVVANKMWEEWTKYIENFEIAASLSNATDPVRRSQLLFLSMGEELQGIVRAAKLRPNLNHKNCYTIFIKNIEDHLRSMTDTAAEHEAFSSMQQGKGETVVRFHARLMEKVRLCRYSPSDQDRFVRAQLLKGMANRELARTARTFGYEANFVVQSATRDEAYQIETAEVIQSYDGTINHVRGRMLGAPFKRESGHDHAGSSESKQPRFNRYTSSSRRERCSRCNKWAHRNRPCPALKLKCNVCGKFGHFAIACRRNRVNAVEDNNHPRDTKPEKEEEVK